MGLSLKNAAALVPGATNDPQEVVTVVAIRERIRFGKTIEVGDKVKMPRRDAMAWISHGWALPPDEAKARIAQVKQNVKDKAAARAESDAKAKGDK